MTRLAALNAACFLIFGGSIFVMLRFPDGGHRARQWLKRVFAPVTAHA